MISSRLRLLASAGILCGALTASTIGSAFAAPATAPGTPPVATTSPVSTGDQTTPTARTTANHHSLRNILKGASDELAKLFGITTKALHQQLAQGETLTQIATANGKTSADVQATLLSVLKTRLDRAVAAGKLSSQHEAAILAKAPAHLSTLTNKNLAPLFKRVAARHHQPAGKGSAPTATTTGVGQ